MIELNAPRFGNGIGLHRVEAILVALEIDSAWLSKTAVSIAGSNGKGSTSVCCAEIAAAHGLKTGLFTSPHLLRVNERFQINGVQVSDEELEKSYLRVKYHVDEFLKRSPAEKFGAFEIMFLAAVELFYRKGCEICVYEAGIGGRYDPVRLANAKVACVTSLDLEHTELLGNSLQEICLDKTDICAVGGKIFYGKNCSIFAELVASYCRLSELSCSLQGHNYELQILSVGAEGTRCLLKSDQIGPVEFITPLIGAHQGSNAALAILMFHHWSATCHAGTFSPKHVETGLAKVKWPGRLQVLESEPLTVIDVGHSPDGVRASLAALKEAFSDKRFVLVTGVSADKDAEGILSILCPAFENILCTRAHYRGNEAVKIAEIARMLNPAAKFSIAPTITEAIKKASAIAIREDLGIYVAGGMYLATEYGYELRGGDARSLPHLF